MIKKKGRINDKKFYSFIDYPIEGKIMMLRVAKKVVLFFLTYLQMAGILFDKFFLFRTVIIGLLLYIYFFHLPQNTQLAHYSFLFSSLLYFLYLFIIFTPFLGIRDFFISKFGEENSFLLHQLFLSILFFNQGLSLAVLPAQEAKGINITPLISGTERWNIYLQNLQIAAAGIIIFISKVVKLLATVQLGIDGYYWKDLFLRKKITHFQNGGIYKYFKNPMYGIGNISIYGIALLYSSPLFFMFGIFYHFSLYIFYRFIEKPHMQIIYREV